MESTQEAAQRYLDGLLEQVKLMTRSQGRLLGAWQEMPGHSAPNHNSFIRALAADAGWNMGELGRSTRHIKKVCRVLRRRGIDSAAVSNLLTYCYGHTLYTNTDWLRMRDQLETVLSAEWAPDPGLVGIFLESLENLGAGDAAAMVQKLAGED